jgi:tetratricopeptide (TPR) repeat protein
MNCSKCGQQLPPGAKLCSSCSTPAPASCPECGEPTATADELCPRCRTAGVAPEEETTDPDFPPHRPMGEEDPYPEVRSRFVGRLDVLQQLKKLFLASKESRALNAVTVVGNPGVGKTRLAVEFSRSVRAAIPETRVLSGNAPGTGSQGYGPVIQILSSRFGITENEYPHDARDKIEQTVKEVMPERLQTETTHLLAHLMNFPFPNSLVVEPLAQVPGQLEVRTYIAVRRFFERDCETGALLLCFDGAERAGVETVNFIHYLAEGLRNCPVLILVTARPTLFRRHPQWGQGEFSHNMIDVGPLSSDEAEQLFTELVHCGELPEELLEVARDHLGGYPRAIEELTRYLLEVGVVAPSGSRWTLSLSRLREQPIPRTHEEILRARLQALSPGERGCLEKAAAIGEVFWLDAVVALVRASSLEVGDPDGPTLEQIGKATEQTRPYVESIVSSLCLKGLVTRCPTSTIAGEEEYRFAYPPTWDLAYELVDPDHRRGYHRLIAQWLELLPEGRMEEQQAHAGRHLERAGLGVMAAARFRRAADAARARYFNDKSIRLYSRALACVGEADAAARIHMWHDLGSVYQLKGDIDAALDAFERMLRLSWMAASKAKGAVAFNKMGRVWRQKGNMDLALEYLQRGLDLFEQSGDLRGVATSLDDIGQVLWMIGRYEDGLDSSAKALEMRRQLGDRRSIAVSLSNIGNIEKSRGLFDEAEACFREAMHLRQAVGDRYGHVVSQNALGSLSLERGDLDQARDTWEDALAEAEQIGALPLQMTLLNNLGETALAQGKLPDARQRIERALALATEMEDQPTYVDVALNLSTVELREGNAPRAKRLAEECLELARKQQMRRKIGRSYIALAEVHAAILFDESKSGESRRKAVAHFDNAVEVFRGLGNEAELARALRRLGEYLIEQGTADQGRKHLQEAAEIFDRLGMRSVADVRRTIAELDE